MGKQHGKHQNSTSPNQCNRPPSTPLGKIVATITEPITVRHQDTSTDNQRYTEEKDSRFEQLKQSKLLNKITAIAAIAGIASVLGLIVTIIQSRNSLQIDERAYVLLDAKEFKITPDSPDRLGFKVGFANTGKTPAYKTYSFCSVHPDISTIPDKDTPKETGLMILAPSGIDLCYVPQVPGSIDAIKAGARLYFFGTVWYEDAFGQSHWTQFC